MKDDDEYELTPHRELVKLREELEQLKKSNTSEASSSDDMLAHIKDLNHSIKSLTILFKEAAQDLTHSDEKVHEVKEHFSPMMDRMEMLVEQNKKIAAGIVSVAELIKEKMSETSTLHPEPTHHDAAPDFFGGSTSPSTEPMPPPISASSDMPPGLQSVGSVTPPPMNFTSPGSPPPPPPDPFSAPEPKKKGLFDKFK